MQIEKGASLIQVKEMNRRQLRRAIYRQGPVARNQLARELGVSLPTVTTSVAAMLEEGLLVETPADAAPGSLGGRPAMLVDFRPEAGFAVGVELGPYGTCACLADLRGGVRRQVEGPPPPPEYSQMLAYTARLLAPLCADAPAGRLLGVGIGLPGFVESERGVLRTGLQESWTGRPLADDLATALGHPVWADNNVRMRALWRDMLSGAPAPATFAYLFVSKGIACPLMIHNDLLAGARATAGEIGHTILQPDGPVCPGCGRRGCLEALAGEAALTLRASALLAAGQTPTLAARLAGREPDMADLLAVLESDPAVAKLLLQAMDALGLAAANLFNFIGPDLLVADGRIFAPPAHRERFLEVLRKNLFGLAPEEARVEFAPDAPLTGALGAAAHVIRRTLLA